MLAKEYTPSPHTLQLVLAFTGVKLPTGHDWQALEPLEFANFPAMHARHVFVIYRSKLGRHLLAMSRRPLFCAGEHVQSQLHRFVSSRIV